MTPGERDQEFAELLSVVIGHHAVASRLKATAALAEEILASAMRVGDAVRRALRDGDAERPSAADVAALVGLAERLEHATDAVLAESLAQDLRRAAAAGDVRESARLALELFADLARPQAPQPKLYAAVAARRRSRGTETLVHPAALADEIRARSAAGLTPASGDPADDQLLPEPIALAPTFDACGAEIALCRSAHGLEDGLLEDTASGDLLVFSRSVAGPFTVTLARVADDEWWAASPFAYADYRTQLDAALRARGITVSVIG